MPGSGGMPSTPKALCWYEYDAGLGRNWSSMHVTSATTIYAFIFELILLVYITHKRSNNVAVQSCITDREHSTTLLGEKHMVCGLDRLEGCIKLSLLFITAFLAFYFDYVWEPHHLIRAVIWFFSFQTSSHKLTTNSAFIADAIGNLSLHGGLE